MQFGVIGEHCPPPPFVTMSQQNCPPARVYTPLGKDGFAECNAAQLA
jgi:hypothetical protein